jgi:glycosyltransferase involved in cell wall biosynthesis
MYLGAPVVATAATGNLDLIEHAKNGMLFKDGDIEGLAKCIRMIADNPTYRQSLISGGITTAKDTFSIERTVATYESFYERLLSSRKF